MTDIVRLIPPRTCFCCFDMERAGPNTCDDCGRPYGKRLPENLRPAFDQSLWGDAALSPGSEGK